MAVLTNQWTTRAGIFATTRTSRSIGTAVCSSATPTVARPPRAGARVANRTTAPTRWRRSLARLPAAGSSRPTTGDRDMRKLLLRLLLVVTMVAGVLAHGGFAAADARPAIRFGD